MDSTKHSFNLAQKSHWMRNFIQKVNALNSYRMSTRTNLYLNRLLVMYKHRANITLSQKTDIILQNSRNIWRHLKISLRTNLISWKNGKWVQTI